MSNITCRFCRLTRQKAKEHIWPRWLQIKMYGNTKWPFAGAHVSTLSEVSNVRRHTGENLVLGDVCKVCNGGWMNDLESKFRPIHERIIVDRTAVKRLTKLEREDLANWAFKTAIVISAGSNYRGVPTDHFHHLYDHKSVPKDVKVDVGLIEDDEKLSWILAPLLLICGTTSEIQHQLNQIRVSSYCIAIQIQNLGIRISWFKNCKEQNFELKPAYPVKNLRIWPYIKNGIFSTNEYFDSIEAFQLAILLKKDIK